MKKIFISFILALSVASAFAQEQAVYSQYNFFPILVNPGYTGFQDKHEILLNARRAWTNFPGTPSTYTFMYGGPVGDKLALGAGLLSENIGDMNTTRLQLNYAFRFRIQKARIGLGLSTEFLRSNISNDLLSDNIVNINDEVLEGAVTGRKFFDASVGAHMLYDERFFLSLSMPNTIRARLDEIPVATTTQDDNGSLFQFYIFQMGYIIDVPSQNFKIVPSFALRRVRNVPFQVDFNVQGRFLEDKLIAGIQLRPVPSGGSMGLLIGSKYKGAQIYYSYDVSFGRFQTYNNGSHEISIAFAIDRKVKGPALEEEAELYR